MPFWHLTQASREGIPGNPERDDRSRSQQSLPFSAFRPKAAPRRTADLGALLTVLASNPLGA
jgi:hypothetical protein